MKVMFPSTLTVVTLLLFPAITQAEYGKKICNNDVLYDCYKVKKGETWESLFPDSENRTFVKKLTE